MSIDLKGFLSPLVVMLTEQCMIAHRAIDELRSDVARLLQHIGGSTKVLFEGLWRGTVVVTFLKNIYDVKRV
jgi:hypothetical protein